MPYLLALDQGTTSSRSILFDLNGVIVSVAQQEFQQYFPQDGWVEHDAEQIWESQIRTAREVLEKTGIVAKDIAAIGITNQRETTVVWDRSTGKPLYKAIVWQDRRTASMTDRLKEEGLETLFRERTGLVLDPYFSGSKLAWLLENVDGLKEKTSEGG
jgi:glycerol kinase